MALDTYRIRPDVCLQKSLDAIGHIDSLRLTMFEYYTEESLS